MTFFTNRNYIKPMLRCIIPMVILFCLCGAVTALQSIRFGQSTFLYSICYSMSSLTLFRMSNTILFLVGFIFFAFVITFLLNSAFFALSVALMRGFTFFGLAVSFLNSFAFFSLTILFLSSFTFLAFRIFRATSFAIRSMTVFGCTILMKFRQRFDLLAMRTSFRYDFSSHLRFSYKRFWSEPVAIHMVAVGSSYCTADWGDFK